MNHVLGKPVPLAPQRACKLCLYFDGAAGAREGRCRRYAPRPSVGPEGGPAVRPHYPLVLAEDWCGEFEQREGRK